MGFADNLKYMQLTDFIHLETLVFKSVDLVTGDWRVHHVLPA